MITKLLKKDYNKLENDRISEFRLENGIYFMFIFALLQPILMKLNGLHLSISVIAGFAFIKMASAKMDNIVIYKYNIEQIWKFGIWLNILMTFMLIIFFIDEIWFVVVMSLINVLEMMVFSSYAILLDEHLAFSKPHLTKVYKGIRSTRYADVGMLGLAISGIIGMYSIYIVIVAQVMYIIFSIKNYNFYDKLIKI